VNDGPLPYSRCWKIQTEDHKTLKIGGFISYSQNYRVPGYHVAARILYGLEALKVVNPKNQHRGTKTKIADFLTVSHLCGSPESLCCNPGHLVIESKRVNDERTHCHFCLNNVITSAKRKRQPFALADWWDMCSHEPKCGSFLNVTV